MESLDRSKAVIDLGKRLVAELKLGDDLLARWMAHVIAERIDAAERASPEARASAQDACKEAIFSLWDHRNSLPPHLRPFRELDPLLRTLASLDVDSETLFRYFPRPPSDEDLEAAQAEQKRFLNTAVNLDYSARALIQFLLSAAAQQAADKAMPWLDAAIEAGTDAMLEVRIVEFVAGGAQGPGAEEVARKALQDKIEKLEAFSQLATSVAAELRGQLEPPTGGKGCHLT